MKFISFLCSVSLFISFGWNSSHAEPLTATKKTVEVIVSRQALKAGAKVSPKDFELSEWPISSLPEGVVRDVQEVAEKYISRDLSKGSVVLTSDLSKDPTTDQLPIHSGLRAVSIPVDNRSSVEGFAKPGTRVDVVYTFVDLEGRLKSKILAHDSSVLSLGGKSSDMELGDKSKPASANTITLEVTAEEALSIITAKDIGLISLLLRSSAEDNSIVKVDLEQASSALEANVAITGDAIGGNLPRYCPSYSGSRVPVGTEAFSKRDGVHTKINSLSGCSSGRKGVEYPGED